MLGYLLVLLDEKSEQSQGNIETLETLLKEANISAHSFLLNPIDEDLDMRLLDHRGIDCR